MSHAVRTFLCDESMLFTAANDPKQQQAVMCLKATPLATRAHDGEAASHIYGAGVAPIRCYYTLILI